MTNPDLEDAREEDVGEVGVDDLELLGRLGEVVAGELGDDGPDGGHGVCGGDI